MNRFVFITILLFLFVSCREDIVYPDKFVGNINEPVQTNLRNSYTFIINARDLSTNVAAFPTFSGTLARVSVTLIDYKSGYVSVSVKDFNQVERFRYFANNDINLYTEVLAGYMPNIIEIKMQALSGKLKVQLSRAY